MPAPRDPLRRLLARVPGAMPLARALHEWASPDLRTIRRLEAREPALLQPYPDTWDERYPALFDALAARLAGVAAPRILSFGCSSGAEVRALRRRLPRAAITGIDPNPRALAAARAADPGGDYRAATAPPAGARYDAILALAVFRHGALESAQPRSCAAVLPFARFAAALGALDAALVPGGWLALGNAHFRLIDAPCAAHYHADPAQPADPPPQHLLYGPDDRRLDGVSEARVLFRKV